MTDLQLLLLFLSSIALYLLIRIYKSLRAFYSPTAKQFYQNFKEPASVKLFWELECVNITTVTGNKYNMFKTKYEQEEEFFSPRASLQVRKSAVESEKNVYEGSAMLCIGEDIELLIDTTREQHDSKFYFKVRRGDIVTLDKKLRISSISGHFIGDELNIWVYVEDTFGRKFTMNLKNGEKLYENIS